MKVQTEYSRKLRWTIHCVRKLQRNKNWACTNPEVQQMSLVHLVPAPSMRRKTGQDPVEYTYSHVDVGPTVDQEAQWLPHCWSCHFYWTWRHHRKCGATNDKIYWLVKGGPNIKNERKCIQKGFDLSSFSLKAPERDALIISVELQGLCMPGSCSAEAFARRDLVREAFIYISVWIFILGFV